MLATPMITKTITAGISLLLMLLLLLPLAIAWAVLVLAAVIVYWAFPSGRQILMGILTPEFTRNGYGQWADRKLSNRNYRLHGSSCTSRGVVV